jgi:hypothetical protein
MKGKLKLNLKTSSEHLYTRNGVLTLQNSKRE